MSMTVGTVEGGLVGCAKRSLFVSAPDGLRLHVAEYGSRLAPRLPIVCLPGLARTAADFDVLARTLAGDPDTPRRVLALDYRGRGLSEYDRDPANYTLPTELADTIAALTALSVHRAIFVGTSRGGLLAMLLGAVQPARIAGVVLNDIGPVIEPIGLMRIKSYIGQLPQPRSLAEGAEILKRLFEGQFPKLSDEDWLAGAAKTWVERGDRLVPVYDPRLLRTLDGIDFERQVPSLWPQFDSLARVPMLLFRGALSDLLSPDTVAAMRVRRRDLEFVEVPDQGHAPILDTPALRARIAEFARACDKRAGLS